MKKITLRFCFIVFALVAFLLGTTRQARAANGGCDGEVLSHRKIEYGNTLSQIALDEYHHGTPRYYGQIAKDNGIADPDKILASTQHKAVILTICSIEEPKNPPQQISQQTTVRPMRKFVPPPNAMNAESANARAVAVAEANIAAMETMPKVQTSLAPVDLPAFLPDVDGPPTPATPATAAEPKVVPQGLPTRGLYEVTLVIPNDIAAKNGIVPGIFPALFLENQGKDGKWQKRHKIIATIEAANGAHLVHLTLPYAPPQNASVAIDFQNGNSLFVANDLLSQGDVRDESGRTPQLLKRKSYRALSASYPARPNPLATLAHVTLPTLLRSGSVIAMTGGSPIGLVAVPTSIVNEIAVTKINRNQQKLEDLKHPPLHVEYAIAGQQEQLEKLSKRIAELEKAQPATTKPNHNDKEEVVK